LLQQAKTRGLFYCSDGEDQKFSISIFFAKKSSSEDLPPLLSQKAHQVSIDLAEQLQRRRFLEISQSETRIAYGGHVC
jgi:hypothetical protein